MPAVSVMVTGRSRSGDTEVREPAALMFSGFLGVAWDGYTNHCWTLSEIQSGVKAKGQESEHGMMLMAKGRSSYASRRPLHR